MKTIELATGVKIVHDKNSVSVFSPYMDYRIFNWSLAKKTPWIKTKRHDLLSVN